MFASASRVERVIVLAVDVTRATIKCPTDVSELHSSVSHKFKLVSLFALDISVSFGKYSRAQLRSRSRYVVRNTVPNVRREL